MAFKSDKQRKAVMAKLNQGSVKSDVKPKVINVKKYPKKNPKPKTTVMVEGKTARGSDVTIKHPYGKTVFKDTIRKSNKRYELIDAFPNYGSFEGHKQARNLANQLRSETRDMGSKQSIIIIVKTNASAVYGQI